jgi:hypothetical protein
MLKKLSVILIASTIFACGCRPMQGCGNAKWERECWSEGYGACKLDQPFEMDDHDCAECYIKGWEEAGCD